MENYFYVFVYLKIYAVIKKMYIYICTSVWCTAGSRSRRHFIQKDLCQLISYFNGSRSAEEVMSPDHREPAPWKWLWLTACTVSEPWQPTICSSPATQNQEPVLIEGG